MFPSLGGPPQKSAAPLQRQPKKVQKHEAPRAQPKKEQAFFHDVYDKPATSQKKKKGGGKAPQTFLADAFPELPGLEGKTPSQIQ